MNKDPLVTHCRVVVIDDNVAVADAMARLIRVMGGNCRVAYGGQAGLNEVLTWQPDVVLLDINMPEMDGYEVCRRIREETCRDVVVVALTGSEPDRHRLATEPAGFDLHLTKPADPSTLQTLLTTSPG
jgi:CheY-like chemotaxis protein